MTALKLKGDTIPFHTYWEKIVELRFRTSFVRDFVQSILLNLSARNKDVILVGSGRIRERDGDAFFEAVSRLPTDTALSILESSDIDLAVQLDPFSLENLQLYVPELIEKEETEEGSYGPRELLKSVYECNLGDLKKNFPDLFERSYDSFANHYERSERLSWREDKLLQTKVQLLSVRDMEAVTTIWSELPVATFVKYFWKHSPSFIGKDALRGTFESLERVALVYRPRIRSKKPMWDLSAMEVAPAWEVPFAGDGFVVNAVAAQPIGVAF